MKWPQFQFVYHDETLFLLPSVVLTEAWCECSRADEPEAHILGFDWLLWGVQIVFIRSDAPTGGYQP